MPQMKPAEDTTPLEALSAALVWFAAVIEAADVDPEDTRMILRTSTGVEMSVLLSDEITRWTDVRDREKAKLELELDTPAALN